MQYIECFYRNMEVFFTTWVFFISLKMMSDGLWSILGFVFKQQCTDVHMVSDSDGDDFEDATEFGVDDGEMFGVASSALRKSPMSKS